MTQDKTKGSEKSVCSASQSHSKQKKGRKRKHRHNVEKQRGVCGKTSALKAGPSGASIAVHHRVLPGLRTLRLVFVFRFHHARDATVCFKVVGQLSR